MHGATWTPCLAQVDLRVCEVDVLDDGINECALCELIGPIAHLLDVDANIVSWMPLSPVP